MNIDLSYSECLDVKYALLGLIKDHQECLQDENFRKDYPACTEMFRQQIKRCEAILARIQEKVKTV